MTVMKSIFNQILLLMLLGAGLHSVVLASERTSVVDSLALQSYEERKPALDMANRAAHAKGLNLEALGKSCNLLPIRIGAILTGQAPLEKKTQDCLEAQLALKAGSLAPLVPPPVRWQAGAIYRMHEAIEVYGPALQRWMNERYGDAIMSAIDFDIQVEDAIGKKGEHRIRIIFDGKALPYSTDEGWVPPAK
jgi:cyanate lyase